MTREATAERERVLNGFAALRQEIRAASPIDGRREPQTPAQAHKRIAAGFPDLQGPIVVGEALRAQNVARGAGKAAA
jgi:hypothetical protein